MIRLLILSCSAAKRHDPGYMPAIERYDGPAFRVLRKYYAQGGDTAATRTRIISAKYGIVIPGEPITDYEQLMTPLQVAQLATSVMWHLHQWVRLHPECGRVFINLGAAYMPIIAGFQQYCEHQGVLVTLAAGGIGQRLHQMKAWLEANQ